MSADPHADFRRALREHLTAERQRAVEVTADYLGFGPGNRAHLVNGITRNLARPPGFGDAFQAIDDAAARLAFRCSERAIDVLLSDPEQLAARQRAAAATAERTGRPAC